MTTQPVICLEGVSKIYRAGEVDVPVLLDIDLSIYAGERSAITGRSGSGKSTLMHLLGCLDRPTTGRRMVGGRDTAQMDDDAISAIRGETIGFVFQSFHLLADRSILDNVSLPMEYRGTTSGERADRAAYLLDRVGLGHRLHHRPSQLSGGERQRVAIARSLANRPRILLADEPTGNLDLSAQSRVLDLFGELHAAEGFALGRNRFAVAGAGVIVGC